MSWPRSELAFFRVQVTEDGYVVVGSGSLHGHEHIVQGGGSCPNSALSFGFRRNGRFRRRFCPPIGGRLFSEILLFRAQNA
jgi:hypothetical protein